MSYGVKSLAALAFCGLGIAFTGAVHAEDAPAKKEGKIIVLDGKRVRVDEKMNVIEHLDEKESAKTEKKAEKKEEKKDTATADAEKAAKAAKKEQEKKDKEAAEKKKAEEKAIAEKAKADEKAAAQKKKDEEKAAADKKKADEKASKELGKKEEPKPKAEAAPAKEEPKAAAAAPAAPVTEDPAAAAKAREDALKAERELAREMTQKDAKLRAAVRKLATPGWREAQVVLMDAGKDAVPYLIEAMAEGDDVNKPLPAYNQGGHSKSDSGRASRQRTLAEVASEVLTTLVKTRSDYKGEVPTVDQRAWQTWWTANSATVNFGKATADLN
ncbi:MAG TPA: hypothetical protein VEK08_14085 [Planctomycetota bacterium]|nr:hypothetical protein [Planctomycetota bacterium]